METVKSHQISRADQVAQKIEVNVTYEDYLTGKPFAKIWDEKYINTDRYIQWWCREGLSQNAIICRFDVLGNNTGRTVFAARIKSENQHRAIISGVDSMNESFTYRLIFKK